ncbi:uncharacterized protein LOC113210464 [Frankliniella occidentalis]|uniref:Uncharacterized protein LOC113210464 n=1 Tax=Frankliniella occidentalis TaxID=133901 RepID=A0A6J1STR8_FRAOC|nr:uncharacterized protein LOC113210464 [Frankliniella occidentalis]
MALTEEHAVDCRRGSASGPARMPLVLVALALIGPTGVPGKAINGVLGPFIAYTERFYLCEPNDRPLPWRWQFRTTHFNPAKPRDVQLLTGNITGVNVTFDNKQWVRVIIDVWSNNQWKENAFIFYFKNKGCMSLRENIPSLYQHIFKKRETNNVCRHQPGVYEVNNAPIEWVFPHFPVAFYGRYRFKLMVGLADVLHACLAVDCDAIPKGVGVD